MTLVEKALHGCHHSGNPTNNIVQEFQFTFMKQDSSGSLSTEALPTNKKGEPPEVGQVHIV